MGQESDKDIQQDAGHGGPEVDNSQAGNGHDPKSDGHDGNPAGPQDLVTEQDLVQEKTTQTEPPQTEHKDQSASRTRPPEGRRPRRGRWPWIAAAGLAILAIYLLYHFRSAAKSNAAAKASQQQEAAAITAAESTTGNMNIYVDALGTVTPIDTITLYSQITGQVIGVHYQQGQIVNQGDPLIDIDPRPYQSTLTQAEGNLEHDQGVLAEAVMDLNRYQAAFERNAIARQQYEDQQQAVVQDQGTVKADQGTVAYDKVQLSYCHIVSPITGRVGLRLVDPGNTIFAGSGSTLLVITQLQPITVVFDVSEDDLPQVQAQLRAGHTLQVDAFDRSFDKKIESGRLTSLDNEVDTTTGTVKFRADFPNRNFVLYPNQFVNARLLVKTLSKVTLVPSAAVQQNGTTAFVYVVKPGNTVSVQNVKVLESNDQQTAVQGLNAGVNVATSGFDRLENGVMVSVRGQPSQKSNPSGGAKPSPTGSAGTTAP
ncbi:MAG TPA: efflux RND transporter periplasmic adaptor subunit [Bryobacteraceae bacterium]|nr:efflux RND transporter periplasmic adaptor subunit [Bryobacteraceae bacterium]